MSMAFADQWLGCLDPKMSEGVYQLALSVTTYANPLIPIDFLFELYTPDDYCLRPAPMQAFIDIFALSIIYYEDDPCQPIAATTPLYAWFLVNGAWVESFGFDLSGAPCTQIQFP